jgi:hypothetical protein
MHLVVTIMARVQIHVAGEDYYLIQMAVSVITVLIATSKPVMFRVDT